MGAKVAVMAILFVIVMNLSRLRGSVCCILNWSRSVFVRRYFSKSDKHIKKTSQSNVALAHKALLSHILITRLGRLRRFGKATGLDRSFSSF